MPRQVLAFAQKAIIERGKDILVLVNSPTAQFNPSMIHLPGGRMEFGENVDEHIKREVFEETGVQVDPLDPVDIVTWSLEEGADKRKDLEDIQLQVVAVVRRCKFVSGNSTMENKKDCEGFDHLMWINPLELVNDQNFDRKMLNSLKMYIDRFRSTKAH